MAGASAAPCGDQGSTAVVPQPRTPMPYVVIQLSNAKVIMPAVTAAKRGTGPLRFKHAIDDRAIAVGIREVCCVGLNKAPSNIALGEG